MSKTVHLKNDINVFVETGTVIGPPSTWFEMHVSGGYVGPGGHISGDKVSMRSSATERNRFFLRLDSGKKAEINVHGNSFGVRDGHSVSTALCGHKADHTGWYIGYHNHTTDERLVTDSALDSIINFNDMISWFPLLAGIVVISILSQSILAGVFLGPWAFLLFLTIRKNALGEEIKSAVNAALDKAVAEQEATASSVVAAQAIPAESAVPAAVNG